MYKKLEYCSTLPNEAGSQSAWNTDVQRFVENDMKSGVWDYGKSAIRNVLPFVIKDSGTAL